MFKKKKTLGIQPKVYTLEEVNQGYSHHAMQIGHKTRIISTLEDEISLHLAELHRWESEGKKIPKAAPAAAAAPAPETPAAPEGVPA